MKNLSDEIWHKIFKYGYNDIEFLYSCLLVNKIWSSNVVPILWKQPFKILSRHSYKLISTYFLPNPFYNYHSFLRHLSYYSLYFSVEEWCTINNYAYTHNRAEKVEVLCKTFSHILLLFAKSSNLKILTFVINADNIYYKQIDFAQRVSVVSEILKNRTVSNWISNIEEIELEGDFMIDININLLINTCSKLRKVS